MICMTQNPNGYGGVAGGAGPTGSVADAAGGGSSACNGVPVIRVVSGMKKSFDIQLTQDMEGLLPAQLQDTDKVYFKAKRTVEETTPFMLLPCAVKDAPNGVVTLKLTPAETKYFGMWVAGIQIKDAAGDLTAEYPCYLQIDQGLDAHPSSVSSSGLSIGLIRMALYDFSADANILLQDLEFSDVQIMHAVQRPIDDWNEMPPAVRFYTTTDFPWVGNWLKATCSYLLEMAAHRYDRNTLPHNAGGLAMDPLNRGKVYLEKAMFLRQNWLSWVGAKKTELNMSDMWGSTTIEYPITGSSWYNASL